jgi:hypothetical protein
MAALVEESTMSQSDRSLLLATYKSMAFIHRGDEHADLPNARSQSQ